MLRVATTESQLGSWDDSVEAAEGLGEPDEVTSISADDVRARCASPLFLGAALYRLNATVHPARLALGLRATLLERGVRIHERTTVTKLVADGVETRTGRVHAGATVLAANSATASFPGYRLSLAVASSHIVLTEPVPDILDELGWTGGEAIVDSRTLVHYMRTTRDGRIVFGWGGGTMGVGGRDGRPARGRSGRRRRDGASTPSLLPADGRARGDTRLGRADRRLADASSDLRKPRAYAPRLRVHRQRRRPVVPRRGDPRAPRARPSRRADTASRSSIPPRKLFPPEPLRYAGGALIRRALMAKDAAEDDGRVPNAATRLVSSLPRRLGLRLPR